MVHTECITPPCTSRTTYKEALSTRLMKRQSGKGQEGPGRSELVPMLIGDASLAAIALGEKVLDASTPRQTHQC